MAKQNDENLIFIIEKIWTDRMENTFPAAVGYEPIGYAKTEELAKRFCEKGKTYTQKDCWAIRDPMPEYRYKPLKQVE